MGVEEYLNFWVKANVGRRALQGRPVVGYLYGLREVEKLEIKAGDIGYSSEFLLNAVEGRDNIDNAWLSCFVNTNVELCGQQRRYMEEDKYFNDLIWLLSNYENAKEVLDYSFFPSDEVRIFRFLTDLRIYVDSGIEHPWFEGVYEIYGGLLGDSLDWGDSLKLYNGSIETLYKYYSSRFDFDSREGLIAKILEVYFVGRPLSGRLDEVPLETILARFKPLDDVHREVFCYDFFDTSVEVDDPFQRVLMNIAQKFYRNLVIKFAKKIIPKEEFGVWICDDPVERLRMDSTFARFLRKVVEAKGLEGSLDCVVPISFDEEGWYLQERAGGVRLSDVQSHRAQFEAASVLALKLKTFRKLVSHYLDTFDIHGSELLKQMIPFVNLVEEFRVICDLQGWDFSYLSQSYIPLLENRFVVPVVSHNSLHPRNVLVNFGKGDIGITLLDFENLAIGPEQDDMIRFLESYIKFSKEEKLRILVDYFFSESSGRFDFEENAFLISDRGFAGYFRDVKRNISNPYWNNLIDRTGFKQFYSDYKLREAVLRMWADVAGKGKGQMQKSFEALREMRTWTHGLIPDAEVKKILTFETAVKCCVTGEIPKRKWWHFR